MKKEATNSFKNKKVALILGAVALVWYVASIFTVWH
jgi:hypothetical protein